MRVQARARFVRQAPSKVRRVLDLIRGLDVSEARHVLLFTPRRAAAPVSKLLESAVANAEHNEALDEDELYIADAYAEQGPTFRRWRPRARGRATPIQKQTTHITIVVADTEEELD